MYLYGMENMDEINCNNKTKEILETISTEIGFYETDSDYEDNENEYIIFSEIERNFGIRWTNEEREFFIGATCLERLKFYHAYITENF